MDKKEAFKEFLRAHPKITEYLKNNKDSSIQKLYEIYDIYGEDAKAWSSYITSSKPAVNSFQDILGNINTESIQKHINNAQKAIGVVQELAGKKSGEVASNLVKGPINPRPINKFFED